MSELDDVLNNASGWTPGMRSPLSFTADDVKEYQKLIDTIVGTSEGKSIIKLAWAPSEMRWRPYHLGDDPPGYTFPIFIALWDKDGNEVAAPRWVLLQRAEPQHYAATWEHGRYTVAKGHVWDWKGPCPPERYTELYRHCYHDGNCCPCRGNECECETDNCWGLYAEPDEALLEMIASRVAENNKDSDIQPTRNAQDFSSPNAQRELVSKTMKAEELELQERRRRQEDERHAIETSPVHFLPPGMKKTDSGLIVFDK